MVANISMGNSSIDICSIDQLHSVKCRDEETKPGSMLSDEGRIESSALDAVGTSEIIHWSWFIP